MVPPRHASFTRHREPTSIAIVEVVGVQANSFQMESEKGHAADGLRMTYAVLVARVRLFKDG